MSWTKVQEKTATSTTATAAVTLDSNPTPGNLLVAAFCTSNQLAPVNDGWVLDPTNGHQNDFVGLYFYYRVVAAGDDLTALRTITRTLSAADRTAMWIAEWSGVGPWDSTTVLDVSQSNKGGVGGATSISTGTSATLDQPDGLAVAIFGVSRNISGGTATFTAYTNSFTETVEVGASGGDAPDLAVAVKDVGNSVAAVECTATISTNENRPIGLLFVFKAVPPVTVNAYLSGGASNTNPALSIGGAESTHLAVDVLPDQSRLLADTGGTYYRLVYLRNEANLRSLTATVTATVDEQPATGLAVAVGVATEAAGATVSAVANQTTAPAGVSFGSSASMGSIGASQSRGLWLRLTVTALVAAVADSPWHIDLDCTPL